jgi:hypothetical protein
LSIGSLVALLEKTACPSGSCGRGR